jgi:hypothetical protein
VIYHMGNKNASAAVIQNNTIHIGNRSDDVAIYSYSSRCVIENNILYSTGRRTRAPSPCGSTAMTRMATRRFTTLAGS